MHELLALTWSFFKVGIFAYGGGPSMIPLIQEEVVVLHKWMTIEEFTDALAMGYALPGPIACKTAAIVGMKVAGIPGILLANVAIILPSVIAVLLLMQTFLAFKDSVFVTATLKAVRPAVVAMLLLVSWDMLPKSVTNWSTAFIGAVAFVAMARFNVHPALTIAGSAAVGLVIYR